jgi:hypothetical protein
VTTTGIFAFQAGSAQAFLPVIGALLSAGGNVEIFAGSSARKTFEAAGFEPVDVTAAGPVRELLAGFDAMLTGTSWNPELEAQIWSACRERRILSVAFVDNWVNYAGRFDTGGVPFSILPDVIAVVDEGMRSSLESAGCDPACLVVVGHPALEQLALDHGEIDPDFRRRVGADENELLVLWAADGIYHGSPAEYPQPRETGYADEDLLDRSVEALNLLAVTRPVRLVLRRHPASPDPSLPRLLELRAHFPWVLGDELPKLPTLLASDVVLGGSSMILLEAATVGKPVASCLGSMAADIPLLNCNADVITRAGTPGSLLAFLQSARRGREHVPGRFQTSGATAKLAGLLTPARHV